MAENLLQSAMAIASIWQWQWKWGRKARKQMTPPWGLILFWRQMTRPNHGLSLSLRRLVGENPGNEVRLGWGCCRIVAAFLQTLSTSLLTPWCSPWQSQTTCLAAKICKPFRHPLAFVANAQLPPCHKACHPTLCLGTMHLRCRTKPFWHTFASWNLCEWISVWPTSCFRQKTRLGPMTTTHFSIF